MKTILVTGCCGFIGSNFVHLALEKDEYRIVNLDALTYAGNLENLKDIEKHKNYAFVHGHIEDFDLVNEVMKREKVFGVIHFAAETHVDRSILDSTPFSRTNVIGTHTLLDAARLNGVERFVHVSTDEVYGSLGVDGLFREDTPLAPNSPYSATKAASDMLVYSYFKTHQFPALIIRCSNNYGPYQFPEKLIPLMISNIMADQPIPVYGDGMNVRDWIYVRDFCSAIYRVFEKGKLGEVYNAGGNAEMKNIEVVKTVLGILGKPESLITYVKDRPGHDRRYAMDTTKIGRELGWKPECTFEQGIKQTVEWYVKNRPWWERIKSGAYREYYGTLYGDRLKEGKAHHGK